MFEPYGYSSLMAIFNTIRYLTQFSRELGSYDYKPPILDKPRYKRYQTLTIIGVVNDKCETLREGETSVSLCEPETCKIFKIRSPRLQNKVF